MAELSVCRAESLIAVVSISCRRLNRREIWMGPRMSPCCIWLSRHRSVDRHFFGYRRSLGRLRYRGVCYPLGMRLSSLIHRIQMIRILYSETNE